VLITYNKVQEEDDLYNCIDVLQVIGFYMFRACTEIDFRPISLDAHNGNWG